MSVYYYIADIKGDENRTLLAQRFTMVVASDDAGKTEFRKRLSETGGETFSMLSPTREQMHSIFQATLPANEIDFRLDVVGCNPRELGVVIGQTYKSNSDFKILVEETCAEILGCAGTDTDLFHFNWVKSIVMESIETGILEENKITMSSLFRDDIQEGRRLITVFASTFMCFLAGRIRDKFTFDTRGVLSMLFGRSGVGNCHEYDAHNFFCGLTSATHPCWRLADRKWVELPLGAGPRPIVLKMTVSGKHRGATNRMAEIHTQLGNPDTVRMIFFVVPEDVVANFTFPTDLPEYVELYVTIAKVVSFSDAKKLRS
jgi:hypothetical protein